MQRLDTLSGDRKDWSPELRLPADHLPTSKPPDSDSKSVRAALGAKMHPLPVIIRRLALALLASSSCRHAVEPPPPPLSDTTSHSFTWALDTLGDGASSMLNDVVILNDTLAYAVGEIYNMDSTGTWDPRAYNLVRWDGRNWELLRIQFHTICGQPGTTPYPANGIFAASETNIWVAMRGSQLGLWNGHAQTAIYCLPRSFTIKRIWGDGPSSFYVVGDQGNLMHYDGTTWQTIATGTTLDLQDIYGARNPKSGVMEILTVASNPYSSTDRRILQISGTTATTLSDSGIQWSLSGVWFVPGEVYYVIGGGIYQKSHLGDTRWQNGPRDITTYHVEAIRGVGSNDVFVAGDFGELLQYNKSSWHSYMAETMLPAGLFNSVAVKGDLVMAVGENNPRAIVARGRRIR